MEIYLTTIMNKIQTLRLTLLWLGASVAVAAGPYRIEGVLPEKTTETGYVYLFTVDHNDRDALKDSVPVADGRFLFTGTVERPQFASISPQRKANNWRIVLEPGDIFFQALPEPDRYRVGGAPINDDYNRLCVIPSENYYKADTLLMIRIRAWIDNTWTFEDERAYMRYLRQPELRKATEERTSGEREFMKKYADHPELTAHWVSNSLYDYENNPDVKYVFDRLPEEWQLQITEERKKAQERAMKSIEENPPAWYVQPFPDSLSAGAPYPDGVGETLSGEFATLSSLIEGKRLVLLDFWASWCGPCMEEMPMIAELHRTYGAEGFEVIGISLDTNRNRWKNAIENNAMVWPQLLSTGNPSIHNTYDVQLIPHAVLIDENGTIVARALRGEKLADKIRELLSAD